MYSELASKCAVTFGTKEFTQAVDMAGANGAQCEVTCFVKGGGNVSLQLQGTNDLQNWTDVGTAISVTAVGFFTGSITGVGYQYVRIELDQATSGTAILACGINTANL